MERKREPLSVGVVFGGMSVEHEVSWRSARNVVASLDAGRYSPVLILIDKRGGWYLLTSDELYSDAFMAEVDSRPLPAGRRLLLEPAAGELRLILKSRERERPAARGVKQAAKTLKVSGTVVHSLQVVFPLVHGPNGEDGTLQGLCKLYEVPFIGPGVMASAVCMDKEMTKRILVERGVPVARFCTLTRNLWRQGTDLEAAIRAIGLPLFVKPANLGSSVGITKVKSPQECGPAVSHAFQFDDKVILEESIDGREIECSVLGNEDPIASLPGEVIPREKHEFYSYRAKYLDPEGAELKIPADLPADLTATVRELALKSYTALGCEGMARVDFFVKRDGTVLVNELNTIPGFTNISMYPKLLEAIGIPNRELVHRLIQLALERFQREAGHSRDWDTVLPDPGAA